jgi:hypothetical protein
MQAALMRWLKAQPYTKPSKVNELELAGSRVNKRG